MKRYVYFIFIMFVILPCTFQAQTRSVQPVKLIFDTDMGNDIDDALALALIHELADRGEVDLLAVTISKDNKWCAPFIDLVNTFYGRPDIPIGVVRDGKTPEDYRYIRPVAERTVGGNYVYPRDLTSGENAPEATRLLREILVSQPDGSVVLVSVGFLTNMARLIDSPADDVSPLTGTELVNKKISLYVAMAGAFSQHRKKEYNAYIDAEASNNVFEHWQTRLVASGYEIGDAIRYPAYSIEHDFNYVPDHPISEAYRLYMDMPYDRQCWDLTAVLYAVRQHHGYFGLSYPGKIHMNKEDVTEFTEQAGGLHQYLTVTPEQVNRIRETFVHLVSSPPKK